MENWMSIYEEKAKTLDRSPPIFYLFLHKHWKIFVLSMLAYPIIFSTLDSIILPMQIAWLSTTKYITTAGIILFLGYSFRNYFTDYLGLTGVIRVETEYFRMPIIFRDLTSYNEFVDEVIIPKIYPKRELLYGVISWLIAYFFALEVLPRLVLGNYYQDFLIGSSLNSTENSYLLYLVYIEKTLSIIYWFALWILFTSAVRFIFNTTKTIFALRDKSNKLAITIVLDILKNAAINSSNNSKTIISKFSELLEKGRYSMFLRFADSISRYLSKMSFVLIITAIIYSLTAILAGVNRNSIIIFYSSFIYGAIMILLGFTIFIHPQLFIYDLLKSYKTRLSNLLESLHEIYFLRYLTTESNNRKTYYLATIERLETALEYVKNMRSMPFSFAQFVKIISISLVWIEVAIIHILGI